MENFSLDNWMFWIFVIPGFLMVWIFRYFHKSKSGSEFEYIGLSIFWGMLLISLVAFLQHFRILKLPDVHLNNSGEVIGFASILCIVALLFGWA
jgi:hypothetical protein